MASRTMLPCIVRCHAPGLSTAPNANDASLKLNAFEHQKEHALSSPADDVHVGAKSSLAAQAQVDGPVDGGCKTEERRARYCPPDHSLVTGSPWRRPWSEARVVPGILLPRGRTRISAACLLPAATCSPKWGRVSMRMRLGRVAAGAQQAVDPVVQLLQRQQHVAHRHLCTAL